MQESAIDLPDRRSACGRLLRCALVAAALAGNLAFAAAAPSQPTPRSPAAGDVQRIAIVLARELRDAPPPLSLLDMPPADDGIAGARLAINDNNTTGRFLKQEFTLEVVQSGDVGELVAQVKKQVEGGRRVHRCRREPASDDRARRCAEGPACADLQCRLAATTGCASRIAGRTSCTRRRHGRCWRMRWRSIWSGSNGGAGSWCYGTGPDDEAFAAALRRAAKRFGAKIVEERPFKYEAGSRRADGGHEQIQQQIPTFTQNAPAHDVLMVADEGGLFGEYFPYRSWDARPVAGTQGLVPTSWHPALEQWGATQFQNRFRRLANRPMRHLDYDVWVAVRSIGEAATRAKSAEPADMIAHLKSADFDLAAFKGRKLTYRAWDGQLRQPILIATAKLPVTVSPQPGFLHQFSELDTLGIDKPETDLPRLRALRPERQKPRNGGTPVRACPSGV